MASSLTDPSGTAGATAYRYFDPVPASKNRSWGGKQGRAAGMVGSLPGSNVGADLLAPIGSPLYSPVGGTVVEVFNSRFDGTEEDRWTRSQAVNENGGWGTSIVIKGDDGFYHRLSHMVPNSPTVQKGQRVEGGYRLGQVGQSGNTTGSGKAGGAPHLDWEKFKTGPSGNIRGNDRQFADPINDRLVFTKSGYTDTPLKSNRPGSNYPTPNTDAGRAIAAIRQAGQELGADEDLVNLGIAIASKETGGNFNPRAAGDKSPVDGRMRSIGIFQLNDEGMGAGMSVEERQDPLTNARVAMKSLVAEAKKDPNWRQDPGALAARSQRPAAADPKTGKGAYADDVTKRFAQAKSGTLVQGMASPGAGPNNQGRDQKSMDELDEIIKGYNADIDRLEKSLKGYTDESGNFIDGFDQKAQAARNARAANEKTLAEISKIPEAQRTAKQKADFGKAFIDRDQLNKAVAEADALAKAATDDLTAARNGLRATQTQKSGKTLTPEQVEEIKARTELDKKRAAEIQAKLDAIADPNHPDAKKLAAELAQIEANIRQKDRQLDIDQQRVAVDEGRLGVEQGRLGLEGERNPSVIAGNFAQAERDRATAQTLLDQSPSVIARNLAAAGLDEAQATRLAELIEFEKQKFAAEATQARGSAEYSQAQAAAVRAKLQPEIAKLVSEGKLQQAQADDLIALRPSKIAEGEARVGLTEAQTGLAEAQGQAQLATALSTIWDNKMKEYYARAYQNVQKVLANPNATQDDIQSAVLAGAKDATEFANVFQQFVNQKTQEEVARHNRVTEQSTQFQNEETARNNRWTNIANLQNARANQQQAANESVDDMLGNVRSMNAAAALGATMGVAGVEQVGREHMIGAQAINPVIAGQKAFESDINSIKAGIKDPTAVNLGVQGPSFSVPRPSASVARNILTNEVPVAPSFTPNTDLTKVGDTRFGTSGTISSSGNVQGTQAEQPNWGGNSLNQTNAGATRPETNMTTEAMATHSGDAKRPEDEDDLTKAGGGGGPSTAVYGARFRPPNPRKKLKGGPGHGGGNGVRFRIPGGKR